MMLRKLAGWVACFTVMASSAWAFPTWMGVYGSHIRYNTNSNPGVYTILMNQDYVGLHAEVGVQVNGGSWGTHALSYVGNVDGNSRWQFTPAQAYPAGASVQYYFRAYDDWGGNLYDSRNGQNYSFAIPAGSTSSIFWGPEAEIPVQAGVVGVDIAAYNGALYAAWGTRGSNYDSPLDIWFAKKLPNQAWGAAQYVTQLASAWTAPKIAVSSGGLHLLLNDYATLYYLRSENEGNTWYTPVVITNALYAELRADADNAYVVFNRYTAPETSRIFFTKKPNNGTSFGEPVLVFTNSNYKTTVYVEDLDISGTRLALLTYVQGWYGGNAQYYLHESQDGGANWSGGQQEGQGANIALRPATGSLSYMAVDSSSGGAGLYFQSKPAGWSSWKQGYANVWAGEGTCDGLRWLDNKLVAISQRNGLRYFSVGTVSMDEVVSFGSPVLLDSANSWAVKDISEGTALHLLVRQSMTNEQYFTLSTRNGSAVPVQWAGNTYHWPEDGELDAGESLWVNIESYPRGAAVTGEVVYTTDGSNWLSAGLAYSGATAANDQWHAELGTFAAGQTVRYAVVVRDADGTETWDNNGAQDFLAQVASQSTVQLPVFWALDPYRYDNEKVRVNGAAGGTAQDFGEFASGQALTVSTRPVENGNGNNVQTACAITSVLHYTTVSGNWASAVSVTGVFHAAGFSNKPIYDYFTYDLGTLAPGTKVWFWLEARNGAGTGYAQSAGQDFTFRIAGDGAADGDNDGLPDDWENDWIGSTSEDADGNTDGDGVMGRPMANIIEWLTGTHPTVPNDPTGVKLLWSPAYPQAGETVTLSYFYVNEGNPLFGRAVYAHVGHDDWQDVYDTGMLQPNGAVGRFEIDIQVPLGATEINVVFHNNAGVWDNNSGTDWAIPVRVVTATPAAEPVVVEVTPAAIEPPVVEEKAEKVVAPPASEEPIAESASESMTEPALAVEQPAATVAVAVESTAPVYSAAAAVTPVAATRGPVSKPVSGSIRLAKGAEQALSIRAVGFSEESVLVARVEQAEGAWTAEVPMKKLRDGSFVAVCPVSAGRQDVAVAFRNADGVWFADADGAWVFTLAGNASQSVVLTR